MSDGSAEPLSEKEWIRRIGIVLEAGSVDALRTILRSYQQWVELQEQKRIYGTYVVEKTSKLQNPNIPSTFCPFYQEKSPNCSFKMDDGSCIKRGSLLSSNEPTWSRSRCLQLTPEDRNRLMPIWIATREKWWGKGAWSNPK
jgi:hypothetical protein